MGSAVASLLLVTSLRFQRRGHLFKPAAHRTVDHFVAGRDAHAADQLLVHGDARLDPALQAPRDVRDETVDLGVVERKGGADLGLDHAFELVLQLDELLVDLRKQSKTVVRDQHANEVPRVGRKILLAQLHEQVVELLRAEIGVRDARAHVRMRRDPRHDREHAQPRGESARALGEAEHGFGHGQISRFSWPSSSACVSELTSRRRIFSAPATASEATCSRSISFARAICWSMSALAATRMRSASAFAAAFASSSICASRFSAEPMISPTRSRALASSSCARLPAASSSCRPRSPAASPSAICFWRSSILRIRYGQMNLTVNQMKSAKLSACAIKVRLKFM